MSEARKREETEHRLLVAAIAETDSALIGQRALFAVVGWFVKAIAAGVYWTAHPSDSAAVWRARRSGAWLCLLVGVLGRATLSGDLSWAGLALALLGTMNLIRTGCGLGKLKETGPTPDAAIIAPCPGCATPPCPEHPVETGEAQRTEIVGLMEALKPTLLAKAKEEE